MSNEIVFENISKTYMKNEPITVLHNISFSVKMSDMATLYGPSGSGKSTILNLASGLDYPTSGSIFLGNQKISELNAKELTLFRRKNVGFIFQNYNLFSGLNVLENIEIISLLNGIAPAEARSLSKAALEKVGLTEKQFRYPDELSGGQQQRVAIARAIASKPRVIFADEPTANLDSITAKSIIDLFFELNQSLGTTIFFSTHDQNIIERVNNIIKIKDGTIQ